MEILRFAQMSKTVDVDDATFEAIVMCADVPVLVHFWSAWCDPCLMLSPILDEIAEEYEKRLNIVKINTEKNMEVVSSLNISGVPCLLLYKNGELTEKIIGFRHKAQLKDIIDKHI
jgi:thioredoxin 1